MATAPAHSLPYSASNDTASAGVAGAPPCNRTPRRRAAIVSSALPSGSRPSRNERAFAGSDGPGVGSEHDSSGTSSPTAATTLSS